MYEVEVKVAADHETVRARLEAAGAEFQGRVAQSDTYFDAPHRDFAETDEALRVRRVVGETGARLAYKGPLVEAGSKSRVEIETSVEDGDATTAIVKRLGFTPVETVEKTREVHEIRGYTVVLDDVVGLGEFVEVETESEETESALEEARTGAFELLRTLGLDPDDQLRTSYLGLLLTQRE